MTRKRSADGALDDLLANPDDQDLQAALRVRLKKPLEQDSGFADEISQLFENTYSAEVRASDATSTCPSRERMLSAH